MTFAQCVREEIATLRKQLDKDGPTDVQSDSSPRVPGAWTSAAPLPEVPRVDPRRFEGSTDRIWVSGHVDPSRFQRRPLMPGELPPASIAEDANVRDGRDMRSRALQAASLGRSFLF